MPAPRWRRLLDEYEFQLGINQFDLAIDFGWFYFLTKPIFTSSNSSTATSVISALPSSC
ncbi:MAG: YidC/Oxa1 family insertase periplasmic-domain containing protein [Alphaproteobacteria bacterium]